MTVNRAAGWFITHGTASHRQTSCQPVLINSNDVDVHCDYIGGGFGSKFKPDYWGIAAAEITIETVIDHITSVVG